MKSTKLKHNATVGVAVFGDPQKRKTKFNANSVGAGLVPAQNEKGITLIALIITIIVMLILVGVTINVALNGGLFKKAETATKQTQIAVDREELLSAVAGAIGTDGKVNFAEVGNNLSKGWTWVEGTGSVAYTSPKGNTFIVNENGNITEGGSNTPSTPTEPTKPTPELPEGLTVGSEFEMDADQDGIKETWIVLYDGTASHLNENEIEVISKNTMGEELALGKTDTEAIENATDINGNGTLEDIEIAIYSYNNAIDRINNYCDGLIKIGNLGVRSVGSVPGNPSYRNTSPYAIQNLDKWENKTAWNTYGVLGEDEDNNLKDDYTQMNTLGIKVSGDANNYWYASRNVLERWDDPSSDGWVDFNVRSFRGTNALWSVYSYSYGFAPARDAAYAVRPVVKLQYP